MLKWILKKWNNENSFHDLMISVSVSLTENLWTEQLHYVINIIIFILSHVKTMCTLLEFSMNKDRP